MVPLGYYYRGQVSKAASGLTCKNWSSTRLKMGNHNFCRNPKRFSGGVGCFTAVQPRGRDRWERCDVPRCPAVPRSHTGRSETVI